MKTLEGGDERGYDAGKKVTGRKHHIVVDTLGLLLVVIVTSANVQDRAGSKLALQGLYRRLKDSMRIELIWADSSYRGELIAWVKLITGCPWKLSRKWPIKSVFRFYLNAGLLSSLLLGWVVNAA